MPVLHKFLTLLAFANLAVAEAASASHELHGQSIMMWLFKLLNVLMLVAIATALENGDPYDLSVLTKGAAIGDSYAAGIGAGNPINWGCSRYDGSYANLVVLQMGVDPKVRDFTFSACSGSRINDVVAQARRLSGNQEYIMMSAGGNEIDLAGILNSCIYSYWEALWHPNCDGKLSQAMSILQSGKLSTDLDNLINSAVQKLSTSGILYVISYAKFFDTIDNTCDGVSWHVWLNLFNKEYLTKPRRQAMNNLVDALNLALKIAVTKAGHQVQFINYDHYVEVTHGRYCQPGQDESRGRSANRQGLFFYEMKSEDVPWSTYDVWSHEALQRRTIHQNKGEPEPVNETLNAMLGAFLEETIEDNPLAVLDDSNANNDLEAEVWEEEHDARLHRRFTKDTGSLFSNGTNLGTKMTYRNGLLAVNGLLSSIGDDNTSPNASSLGTVVANGTHILLADGRIVAKASLMRLIVSDRIGRVFHPTQAGHAIIANLILFHMQQNLAETHGISFAREEVIGSGTTPPQVEHPACNSDLNPATSSDRNAMMDAMKSFCSDPVQLKGTKGATNSLQFWNESLDYMNIAIEWPQTANIGQHSCEAWFGAVIDGCDIPRSSGENQGNFKHGGTVHYISQSGNATMSINPLVVRRMWNKGKADARTCADVGSDRYLDQATLEGYIEDFCRESAARGIAFQSSEFERTFGERTPSQVVLRTKWPKGDRHYEVFKEECDYYLRVLTNGCSLPGPNNQRNWKHGGVMSDNNGIEYSIAPAVRRPLPPNEPRGYCWTKNHLFYWTFNIRGGGWESSEWGKRKGGLKDQLKGCGLLSEWKFEYYDTPQDNGIEWWATGQLDKFMTEGCVGRAIASAGGWNRDC